MNKTDLKPRLIKRAEFEQLEAKRANPPVPKVSFQSQLILARRDFLLSKRECNANAKQQFAELFRS